MSSNNKSHSATADATRRSSKNAPTMVATTTRKCLCQFVTGKEATLPWDHSVLCSACLKQALGPQWKRHEEALIDREVARERCAQKLASLRNYNHNTSSSLAIDNNTTTVTTTTTTGCNSSNLPELQFESQRLRDRRAKLRQQCDAMAVDIASLAVQNEEKKASLNPLAELHRQQLQRLDQSVCEGSMKQSIESAREQVRILRFQWALKAFAMHRLDVRAEDIDQGEEEEIDNNNKGVHHDSSSGSAAEPSTQPAKRTSLRSKESRTKQARGIGKIGGLPLPHAGPELYGVLPPQELQSALRLVASTTCSVARCLGINLPHPVLLHPSNSFNQGDIIHSAIMKQDPTMGFKKDASSKAEDSDPLSTASLLSLLEFSLEDSPHDDATTINNQYHNNRRQTSKGAAQQGLEERADKTVVPPSMEPSLVTRRLHHAIAAVLAEADPCTNKNNNAPTPSAAAASAAATSSQYALAADNQCQDEFVIALQLLQNNVIALCIRAGVPVSTLFPGEAVLLNLYALQVFCESQIKKYLQ